MIYLDTHLVIWLYAGEQKRLSKECVKLIEKHELFISPIVSLEIQYLYEINRIKEQSSKIVSALKKEIGLRVCDCSFEEVSEAASRESWTRDPFDRIIVSNAKIDRAQLLTKDETIRANYKEAIW